MCNVVVQTTKWKKFYCPQSYPRTSAPCSSDSSEEETEGARGGGDTVADEEDEGEEDIENLNIEHVDEMNNVLLGKGRRGT